MAVALDTRMNRCLNFTALYSTIGRLESKVYQWGLWKLWSKYIHLLEAYVGN